MATGTFTYNALRTKTLKERIKTQIKIVSHSNSTRAMLLVQERLPLNHIFPYAYVGLVWFERYCGKMYSRHLFSYGGLRQHHVLSTATPDNCKKTLYDDLLSLLSSTCVIRVVSKLPFSFLLCDEFLKTYFLSMPQLSKYVSIRPNERF